MVFRVFWIFLSWFCVVAGRANKGLKAVDLNLEVSLRKNTSVHKEKERAEDIFKRSLLKPTLVLICSSSAKQYAQCHQFPSWLNDFQQASTRLLAANDSIEVGLQEDIMNVDFVATMDKNLADSIRSQSSKEESIFIYAFPALIYVVSARPFLYPGGLDDNETLTDWLSGFKNSFSVETDFRKLDFLRGRMAKSDKLLILVRDRAVCKFELNMWHNLARSLSDYPTVTVGYLDVGKENSKTDEGSTTKAVELKSRFSEVDIEQTCPTIVLIQANFYTTYQEGNYVKDVLCKGEICEELLKSVRLFAVKSDVNKSNQAENWWSISRSLTDIELFYFVEEARLDRNRRKLSFVMVGATGGLGVIVLAISIFWALKTSDAVKQ